MIVQMTDHDLLRLLFLLLCMGEKPDFDIFFLRFGILFFNWAFFPWFGFFSSIRPPSSHSVLAATASPPLELAGLLRVSFLRGRGARGRRQGCGAHSRLGELSDRLLLCRQTSPRSPAGWLGAGMACSAQRRRAQAMVTQVLRHASQIALNLYLTRCGVTRLIRKPSGRA